MTLLFIGLIIGFAAGYLFGTAAYQKLLPTGQRRQFMNNSAVASGFPAFRLVDELHTRTYLLAEDRRNSNMREALRLETERAELEHAYQTRFFR